MNIEIIQNAPASNESSTQDETKNLICNKSDLVENSGVCALYNSEQIALFFLPKTEQKIFALANWDPIGKANVLSRGILGDIKGTKVISSPLYKQHFNLETGQCMEDESIKIKTYPVYLKGNQVFLA